jgi:signal transduction histidine kinase/ligand-binding sensor domain-containing protein
MGDIPGHPTLRTASWRWPLALAVLLAVACLVPRNAHALDPAYRITQYAHTVWRPEEGAFPGAPRLVTQTADGYLWIGTTGGLVRFDGARFVPLAPPPGERLRNPNVSALLPARDGSLWIGTGVDLEHWKGGHLSDYGIVGEVTGIAEDGDGTVWASTTHAGGEHALCRTVGTASRCLGAPDGLTAGAGNALLRRSDGDLWIADVTALHHWHADAEAVLPLKAKALAPDQQDGIVALAFAHDGSLWVGCSISGPGLGLLRVVDGQWASVKMPGLSPSSLAINALLVDREDALWIGTVEQGLYRLRAGQLDHFGSADGLSSDTVTALFEDAQGNLWVVTSKGLERLRDLRVASYGKREGLSEDSVGTVLAAQDGSLWIQNFHALDRFLDGRVTSIRLPRDLPGSAFTALMEDAAGRLWAGVDDGIVVFDHGRPKHVASLDGKAIGVVVMMSQDVDGDVWVTSFAGPTRRLLRVHDDRVQADLTGKVPPGEVMVADARGGAWLGAFNGDLVHVTDGGIETVPFHRPPRVGVPRALVSGPDGSVIGGTSAGLIGWRDGTSRTMTTDNGLPCNRTFALVRDRHENLWLYTACGLVEVSADDLAAWWRSQDARLKVRVFDTTDGARPADTNFGPKAARSTDGRLWFANDHLLQSIDPVRLDHGEAPPPVYVEALTADGVRHERPAQGSPPGAVDEIRLQPRTRDIQIDYTAPRFAIPQRVAFRYRLEGHDADWQQPGTRRQAFYTDLAPGHYRFHVIAANEDGAWNESGATLDFVIPPTFIQTRWFTAMCVAAGAVVAWLLVRLRLRQVATRERLLADERLGERERIARELHDTLLQSTQALSMRLQGALNQAGSMERMRPLLEEIVRRADEAVVEGRDRILGLRSGRRSLREALAALPGELGPTDGPAISVSIGSTERALDPRVSEEILNIAREATHNALRHAQARTIAVDLACEDDALRLKVTDDGRGMGAGPSASAKPGHWGLHTMRERADAISGRLDIRSATPTGTEIVLEVPAAVAYRPH